MCVTYRRFITFILRERAYMQVGFMALSRVLNYMSALGFTMKQFTAFTQTPPLNPTVSALNAIFQSSVKPIRILMTPLSLYKPVIFYICIY